MIEEILKKHPVREFRKSKVSGANKEPKPIVQWVGGKRQLINDIDLLLPKDFGDYYEPFLGGAAVYFHLLNSDKITSAYLSDLNYELISLYKTVLKRPNKVSAILSEINDKHSKELYYEIRNIDREEISPKRYKSLGKISDLLTDEEAAARFLYLNKTCFNALYRVNSENLFNVPVGKSLKKDFSDKGQLELFSRSFSKAKITCCGYKESLLTASAGDFVYFDPPYAPVQAEIQDGKEVTISGNFTSYTSEGFSEEDQVELKNECDRLTKNGVKFLLSNSAANIITELYKDYCITEVLVNRNMNSVGSKRKKVAKELLIKNY